MQPWYKAWPALQSPSGDRGSCCHSHEGLGLPASRLIPTETQTHQQVLLKGPLLPLHLPAVLSPDDNTGHLCDQALRGAPRGPAFRACSDPMPLRGQAWGNPTKDPPPETQDWARPRPLALNDNYGILTITSWLLRCFTLVHSLEFWVLGWVTHYFSHCLHKLSLKQWFALTEIMSGYLRELDSCSLIPTSHKRASQQPQSTTFLQISPSPWPGPQQGGQTLNSARDFERFIMSVAMGSSFPRLP